MAEKSFADHLRQAGYDEKTVRQLQDEHDQRVQAQQKRNQWPQGQAAGPGSMPQWGQVLLNTMIELLQQFLAQRNLTAGAHPATQQALDTLSRLRDNPEGNSGGEEGGK